MVKVFISWAGETSKLVGEQLHGWLPLLFHGVMPWMSPQDLDKGAQWQREIMENLRASTFGIVCLTPDSLGEPWLLFESGAMSSLPAERVFTFLHRIEYAEVHDPLSMFNHTVSRRDDVMRMVMSLNKVLDSEKVSDEVLRKRFNAFWHDLESGLAGIPGSALYRSGVRTAAGALSKSPEASTMSNPRYSTDIETHTSSEFKLSALVGRETVIIVVGTRLDVELLDRPVAGVLRDAIDQRGTSDRLRRGIVITDHEWYRNPSLHPQPVVAIGGPISNDLTKEIEAVPPKDPKDRAIGGPWKKALTRKPSPRVAVWGEFADSTARAAENFIKTEDGLEAFLELSWA